MRAWCWMAAALPLAASAMLGCRHRETAPRRVVLVGIDTLRADHLGAYGYSRSTSPRIDQLASRGVQFDRAYSTSSWTVPAVASVMTSLYPNEHGAGIPGNPKNLDKIPPSGIRPDAVLLASMFRAAGYATALFSANPFLYGRFREDFEVAEVHRDDGESTMNRALAWLASPDERRRFLYVHLMDVHQPNHFSPEDASEFAIEDGIEPSAVDGDWKFGWSWPRDVENPEAVHARRLRVAAYDAAIRFDDRQVGRLIDALGLRGFDDSVVVVFADHGEEFWDHVAVEHSWADDPRGVSGIGHGHTMFDELLRVPLIVAGQEIEAGARSRCPVSLVDVPVTLARSAGIAVPQSWRGVDLRQVPTSGIDCEARPLFASSPAYGPPGVVARIGPLKLYRRGDMLEMIFNVHSDPAEQRPLAAEASSLVARLRGLADRYQQSTFPSGPAQPIRDEALLKELRALGYL
jgi:arylsulfatase A-like enzyme